MKQQDIFFLPIYVAFTNTPSLCVCNVWPPAVFHYITAYTNYGHCNRLWCCNPTMGRELTSWTQNKTEINEAFWELGKVWWYGWWEYIFTSWRFLWREHCEKCKWHAALLSEVSWIIADRYWRIQLYWLWLSRHFPGSNGSQRPGRKMCTTPNVE